MNSFNSLKRQHIYTPQELEEFTRWHIEEKGSKPEIDALLQMPAIMADLYSQMLNSKLKK